MKIKFSEPPVQASDGWHVCTVADLIDLGPMTSTYNGKTITKDKLKLKGFINEVDPKTGKQIAIDKLLTASVHPKSTLYEAVKVITGAAPKRNGANVFDTDSLINRTFRCKTKQVTGPRGTWARIIDMEPAEPGTKPVPVPLDFKRGQEQLSSGSTDSTADSTEDEGLGFPGTEA
jgi:hypothetical protein